MMKSETKITAICDLCKYEEQLECENSWPQYWGKIKLTIHPLTGRSMYTREHALDACSECYANIKCHVLSRIVESPE